MKLKLAIAIGALAITAASPFAYAQIKNYKLPPGVKTPAGVKLTSVGVVATCGMDTIVDATLEYNLPGKTQVTLWGSVGEQQVDLPAGKGVKRVQIKLAKLDCNSEASWAQALSHFVYLGDTGGRATDSFRLITHGGVPIQ